MTEAMAPPGASFLATRKGQLTLAFLCLVAFMDFMGFAIMTVALPTIQRDLHFSQQNLQWVISGYTVTYGAVVIIAAYLLVSGEAPRRSGLASFDTPGALLGTGGMLLLIYALVKAPDNGWGSAQTIGELAAAVLLAALIINEMRHPNPVLPL